MLFFFLFMGDDTMGFAAGLAMGIIYSLVISFMERRSLIRSSKQNTPVKLERDKFFYIVEESTYVELRTPKKKESDVL